LLAARRVFERAAATGFGGQAGGSPRRAGEATRSATLELRKDASTVASASSSR
jgi:hypothetical protein